MRIAIDARFWGQSGIGRYTQELISHLEVTEDGSNEYLILLRKDNFDRYFPKHPNFKKVLAPWRWYTLTEQIGMPLLIKRLKPDLVHFCHFNVPIFCPWPYLLTIHDLILLHYPSSRSSTLSPIFYWLKYLAYRVNIWLALKRAKVVIAVSQFTKSELVKHYGIDPSKIKVIYEGGDHLFPFFSFPQTDDKTFLLSYNITKPYLLYVGNCYPHKNLERLLAVFKELNKEKGYQLVIAGQEDYFYERLKNQAKSLSSKESVIFVGHIRDNELVLLYQKALLYVFPSLYEGFGLPGIEAMSWGLPVVASKTTSLPEVYQKAAYYFNPHNFEDIKKTIKEVLENESLRERLRQEGYRQVKKFSWQKCARETWELYQHFLNSKFKAKN